VGAESGLTTTLDVLKAIADGKGPTSKILALGYAGWSPGQLESEIMRNGWLHCDADAALVFGESRENLHEAALHKLGASSAMLSTEAGRA